MLKLSKEQIKVNLDHMEQIMRATSLTKRLDIFTAKFYKRSKNAKYDYLGLHEHYPDAIVLSVTDGAKGIYVVRVVKFKFPKGKIPFKRYKLN